MVCSARATSASDRVGGGATTAGTSTRASNGGCAMHSASEVACSAAGAIGAAGGTAGESGSNGTVTGTTADTATAGAGAAVAGTEGAGTAAALRASDGSPRWATATGDPSSSRRTFEEPMDVAAAGN
ncbi:MAG: hypothetical protein EBU31_05985, partial [Proteobacteria bacterium]|nr:hypothetical protein [Pseudomonadota bacterium]